MINQEIIKAIVPWLLVALWVARVRSHRKQRVALVTLYFTVFAGFSSNFTSYYRELGQALSLVLALVVAARVVARRSIPLFSLPLLGMLCFIVISLAVNRSSGLAIDAMVNFVSVSLVSIMVVSELLDRAKRQACFEHFVWTAVLVSMASIVEGLSTGARAEATFSNTNYLAYFLGVASCLVIHSFKGGQRWALLFFIAAGIYFTKSRAGLVFPLFSIFFYVLSLGLRHLILVAPILLVAGLAIILIPGALPGLGRENEGSSDAERLLAIEAGARMTWENPAFGVGWGRYMEEFWSSASRAPVMFEETSSARVLHHRDMVSHNDVVRVFAELGILAGLYFLTLVSWSARSVLRLPVELRGAWAAALVGSIFFSLTHNNLNSALFWIVLLFPVAERLRSRKLKLKESRAGAGL